MIDFINVSKKYSNGTEALKNVNIHIDDGEFVFVVGSSGAGKSTFLKILQREEVASSGKVIINNQCLNDMKKKDIPYFRRELGIVFQDFRLIPNMTVYENVAFAMRVTGAKESEIRKRVPFVITRVGLSSKAKNYPNELSGGEQQRVSLARALVNDASIIVADEPTGNIDPNMAFEIVDLLKDINEKGTTVIMVTHEHDLVRQFDKRVITLESGNIVSDGDIADSPIVETYEKTYETPSILRRRSRKKGSAYYPDEKSVEELNNFIQTLEDEDKEGHKSAINVEELFKQAVAEEENNSDAVEVSQTPDEKVDEILEQIQNDKASQIAEEIVQIIEEPSAEKKVDEILEEIIQQSDEASDDQDDAREETPDIPISKKINGGVEDNG